MKNRGYETIQDCDVLKILRIFPLKNKEKMVSI